MNALTLMIYLISMLGNLKVVFGFLIAGLAIFGGITLIIFLASADNGNGSAAMFGAKWFKRSIPALILVCFITALIPDRQTMIMMAASEVGEYVVQTEQMQGALDEVGTLSKDSVELLREYIKAETMQIRKAAESELEKVTK